MQVFEQTSVIQAPVERVFGFHEEPDAFERLTPPWQPVKILSRQGGIRDGGEAVLELPLGPFRLHWIAEHSGYERNRLFIDRQVKGPFRYWRHQHRFADLGNGQTRLTDHIEFSLPGGAIADFFGGWLARLQLRKLFRYRHEVTRRACESPATEPGA